MILLVLLIIQLSGITQEEFVIPSKFITRFKFTQLTGGVILLHGRLSNYPDTLNFILDTGSGGISLDSTVVEKLKLKSTPSDKIIRGIAGIQNVRFVNNHSLLLPGLLVDSLNFHIIDYGILTAVYGEQIDGIMGYSVLNRYIVKVNYDSSFLEFWTKGNYKYPRGGHLLKPFISTIPLHVIRIKDARQIDTRLLFDMGAGLNMMLSSDFVKDSSIFDKKRKMYTKEAEGLGGKIDMQMTVIKEIKIGPYRFRNVPIFIFDDTYNVTSYPLLGGLIGNDILRRFNVILNYEKRDIYIIPNTHFNEAFDYSYTGIELYYINQQIIIGDVAKNSPAEQIGLLEGDVVISINKNFKQNMTEFKVALQNSGDKISMIIRRNGELILFNFKVKSILKKR
jgi:hypothetical protein